MPLQKNEPLEYARPEAVTTVQMQAGLSHGRMAFLLFVVGFPMAWFYIGLPLLAASFFYAVSGCVKSHRRSIFAWLVLVAFAVLGIAGAGAGIYALIDK
jgi:hypothetical protein